MVAGAVAVAVLHALDNSGHVEKKGSSVTLSVRCSQSLVEGFRSKRSTSASCGPASRRGKIFFLLLAHSHLDCCCPDGIGCFGKELALSSRIASTAHRHLQM